MESRRFRSACTVVPLLLLVFTLAACGAGGGSSGGEMQSGAGGRGDSADSSGDLPSSAAGGAGSGEMASSAGQDESAVAEQGAEQGFDRKIVKSARLGIRAEDVRGSSSRAQEIAADFGGSVQSSRIDRGEVSVYADLVLLVPSGEFEKALDELRGLGKRSLRTPSGDRTLPRSSWI